MARVTVEDVVKVVPNRFEMVILAACRARELGQGSDPVVPRGHDKGTILALREISSGNLDTAELKDRVMARLSDGGAAGAAAADDEDPCADLVGVTISEKDDPED